jgi:hypothetical protein
MKYLLLSFLTFTAFTHCAEESKLYAQLEQATTMILHVINTNPTNTQALKEPCQSIQPLLEKLQLQRISDFDDQLMNNNVSILNTLLNSAIQLNLQEFPYDTLKLLLDHGASHNVTDSQFFGTLLDLEKAGEEGKACPRWIESVGNFTCSWCLNHGIGQRGGDITRWHEKHDATSLVQEHARIAAPEKRTKKRQPPASASK